MGHPKRRIPEGNWVAIDRDLRHYLPRDRPYTIIEAMFSYSIDVANKDENSINGYSRMWDWSRCKVRRFLQDLRQKGVYVPDKVSDSGKTVARHPIRLLYAYLAGE